MFTKKMADAKMTETLELPQGVTLTFAKGIFTVKGPKGEVKKPINNRKIDVETKANEVTLIAKSTGKQEKKLLYTTLAHVKNLVKGVTEGFHYKLKICSGHFPMSVNYKNKTLEIKNFIGEAVPRRYLVKYDVEVKINGDLIEVDGINIEETGQVAANIEKLTKRPGFDKRIFQDGIYLIEKNGKKLSA